MSNGTLLRDELERERQNRREHRRQSDNLFKKLAVAGGTTFVVLFLLSIFLFVGLVALVWSLVAHLV